MIAHLLSLRMCGAVPSHPLYTFLVWCLGTEVTLPLSLLFMRKILIIEFLFTMCYYCYVNRWGSVMWMLKTSQ
jgi:hypothetical protein